MSASTGLPEPALVLMSMTLIPAEGCEAVQGVGCHLEPCACYTAMLIWVTWAATHGHGDIWPQAPDWVPGPATAEICVEIFRRVILWPVWTLC